MEKSVKLEKQPYFNRLRCIGRKFCPKGLDQLTISTGMQTENGETILALGSREGVLAFFAHENKTANSKDNAVDEGCAAFSIPMDEEMKKLESSKLSDFNGPLGPLKPPLGETMYKIIEISGRSKLAGGRAHIDLTLSCENMESAAIWGDGEHPWEWLNWLR